MSKQHFDRTQFWNQTIMTWEKDRYATPTWRGLALRSRMNFGAHWVAERPAASRILDLGCGTGRLFFHPEIQRRSDLHLHGVDFSSVAIDIANQAAQKPPCCTWQVGNVVYDPWPAHDAVVALGLLDWLDDSEVENLAERLLHSTFLLSFSEKRLSIARALHSAYVRLTYCRAAESERPRYRSARQLRGLFAQHKSLTVLRPPGMAFSSFLMSEKS